MNNLNSLIIHGKAVSVRKWKSPAGKEGIFFTLFTDWDKAGEGFEPSMGFEEEEYGIFIVVIPPSQLAKRPQTGKLKEGDLVRICGTVRQYLWARERYTSVIVAHVVEIEKTTGSESLTSTETAENEQETPESV